MRKQHVNKKQDQKKFTKTANKTKSINNGTNTPMRGGFRF